MMGEENKESCLSRAWQLVQDFRFLEAVQLLNSKGCHIHELLEAYKIVGTNFEWLGESFGPHHMDDEDQFFLDCEHIISFMPECRRFVGQLGGHALDFLKAFQHTLYPHPNTEYAKTLLGVATNSPECVEFVAAERLAYEQSENYAHCVRVKGGFEQAGDTNSLVKFFMRYDKQHGDDIVVQTSTLCRFIRAVVEDGERVDISASRMNTLLSFFTRVRKCPSHEDAMFLIMHTRWSWQAVDYAALEWLREIKITFAIFTEGGNNFKTSEGRARFYVLLQQSPHFLPRAPISPHLSRKVKDEEATGSFRRNHEVHERVLAAVNHLHPDPNALEPAAAAALPEGGN